MTFRALLIASAALALFSGALPSHPAGSSALRSFVFEGPDSVFQIGEDLTYNVSYGFIDIGQVRVRLVDKITDQGKAFYKATADIRSYKGVPFVDLHAMYESNIMEGVYSSLFRSRMKDDAAWKYFLYTFDYPNHRVHIERGIWGSSKVEGRDTLPVQTLYQDGLSIFYYARTKLTSGRPDTIPIVVSERTARTFINFLGKRERREIDAVKYPIDVMYIDGDADFVGIFGLTGEFEGWFSNDAARVPIQAKMKVIIGNINIELIKWNREGWNPPRSVEGTGR